MLPNRLLLFGSSTARPPGAAPIIIDPTQPASLQEAIYAFWSDAGLTTTVGRFVPRVTPPTVTTPHYVWFRMGRGTRILSTSTSRLDDVRLHFRVHGTNQDDALARAATLALALGGVPSVGQSPTGARFAWRGASSSPAVFRSQDSGADFAMRGGTRKLAWEDLEYRVICDGPH